MMLAATRKTPEFRNWKKHILIIKTRLYSVRVSFFYIFVVMFKNYCIMRFIKATNNEAAALNINFIL